MLGVLIGLFVFAAAGLLLIVFYGAREIEEHVAEEKRARQTFDAATHAARFLVVTQPAGSGGDALDEPFLAQLRAYVEAEQASANEFVMHPSLENLYRDTGRRLIGH